MTGDATATRHQLEHWVRQEAKRIVDDLAEDEAFRRICAELPPVFAATSKLSSRSLTSAASAMAAAPWAVRTAYARSGCGTVTGAATSSLVQSRSLLSRQYLPKTTRPGRVAGPVEGCSVPTSSPGGRVRSCEEITRAFDVSAGYGSGGAAVRV